MLFFRSTGDALTVKGYSLLVNQELFLTSSLTFATGPTTLNAEIATFKKSCMHRTP